MNRIFKWFGNLIDPFKEVNPQTPPSDLIAFYKHHLYPVRKLMMWVMLLGFIAAIIEVSLFSFLGSLIDMMKASKNPATFFSDNAGALLFMLVVALLLRPIIFTIDTLMTDIGMVANLMNMIRWHHYRSLQRQSLSFFQNDFAGRLASRVMDTGPSLRESAMQVVEALWYISIYTLGALWLFASNDWRLTLPLILWVAGYSYILVYFVPRIKQASTIRAEARSTLVGRIVDSFTNIMAVKLFSTADREDAYIRDGMQKLTDKLQIQFGLLAWLQIWGWLLSSFMIVTTCALGLWLWSQGQISVGAMALATGLVIRIVNMSDWIMWVVTGIFENVGQVQEGMKSVAQPLEMQDKAGSKKLQISKGAISFENVSFKYGEGQSVLDKLSLDIKPSERVGIVGHSGAGKTTLLNLLLRFYLPGEGKIKVDGQDISQITQDSLRAHIGMVTQEPMLLHRTVRENIAIAKPDASDAQIAAVAGQAQAHEFIESLVDNEGQQGYEAVVGERGVKLSGGQRQRVAIARILLKNAPILLLDEATSALDSEIEKAIQEQLFNLMEGKTVIAVAHRLSTISAMDRLVVMDKGQIIEQGPHEELIKQGGLYARLWAHQSGGFVG